MALPLDSSDEKTARQAAQSMSSLWCQIRDRRRQARIVVTPLITKSIESCAIGRPIVSPLLCIGMMLVSVLRGGTLQV